MTTLTPPSQPQSFGERILSRITPVIVTLLVLFLLFNVFTAVRDNTTRLTETYISTLNRTTFALETEFEPYLRIIRELTTDNQMRNYISREGSDINEATNGAKDLIRQNSADFVAIRYLTLDNEIQFEVSNVGGVPIVSDPAAAGERSVVTYDSASIRRIASGSTQQVIVGELRELRDSEGRSFNPPQTSLSLYAPIFANNGLLTAVLQVEVRPQDMLDVVNRASQSIFEPLAGRSLVLLDRNNRIIADSENPSSNYLADLSAGGGNAVNNPLYEILIDFSQREAHGVAVWSNGRVISARHLDFAGAAPVDWDIFIVDDFFTAYNSSIISAALTGVLTLVLGVGGIAFLRQVILPITQPVSELESRVRRLASGEVVAVEHSSAPPSEISQAMDTLSMRLKRLSSELNIQVRRRNRDMSVAGRIGRETATLSDLDILVPRALNLISTELGFYHAQVFLVDESRTAATLRYSRGEAGQKMIEQGHSLRIGSPTVVGTVIADRRPVIINDTRTAQREGRHGFNPLLPDTRAEMGLPLLIGDEIMGVLDIQSKEEGAFLVDDIPTYQLVADQLAIAIYNAQLQFQSERRFQQIDKLNKQLTRQAWENTEERDHLTDVYGKIADQSSTDQITAPISIRGEVIGALEAALPEGAFTDGDRMVLNAVAERVAIAIENARLFQETQSSLAETSTLYQLSQQLNESNTLDDVLHAIIVTVAPDAAGGQIWLFEDYLSGERPELVLLTVDLPLTTRERINPLVHEIMLEMEAHPFLQSLKFDAVRLIADVNAASDMDTTLRQVFLEQLAALALAVVPLNMRGAWKGFLTIQFDGTRAFGEREQRIYTALIGQAGVAIDNRLLLRQTEDALSRNEKLYAASRLINTTQNLEDLVLAAVATATSPYLNFWLALLEGDLDVNGWGNQARVIAKSDMGVAEHTNETHALLLPPDSPMRRREPAIITDAGDTGGTVSAQVEWLRTLGLRFMAIFPLYSDNQPIALFYLVSAQNYELSPEDYEVYKALTGQMSTQIQNRRLLERTEQALNETRRLFEAGTAIGSAQDTNAIYEAVARYLTQPYLAEALPLEERPVMSVTVLLARPEPAADAPLLEYVHQWVSVPGMDMPRTGDLIAHQDIPFAQLIDKTDNGILIYTDLSRDVMLTPRMQALLTQGNAISAAVAPLRSRQRWFGVIIVRSTRLRAFDENYGRYLQALAGQTAVAIERQLLLLETEAERQNLNSILSTLPAGVLVLDPETFVPIQINDRVRELLGQEIDYSVPFDAARYNLYRTGTNLFYPDDELPIYTARRLDRQMFADDVAIIYGDYQTDLLMNAAPIYDNRGQVLAIVTAFQDISNLRSLENTLQENLRETVSLYETQRALSQSDTLEQLLDNIVTQMAMQQPGDAIIVLTDIEDGSPYIARTLMQMIDTLEPFAPFLRSTVTLIEDVTTHHDVDDLTRNMLTPLGVNSMIVMPLIAKTRNRPLGWLIMLDDRPDVFSADQERMVTTLSDMATTAIDNNYLVQSTQKALTETETLYSAAASLSRSRDMGELAGAIERALQSMQPDMYFGFLVLSPESGKTSELFQQHTEGLVAAGINWETVITAELPNRDGLFVPDMAQAADHPLTDELRRAGITGAFAAVNLRVKDIPSGRIIVAYNEPQRFSQGNIQLLSTISDSASVVIDNQLLLEQIQSTLQETSVLYQASRALIEVQDPSDIIEVIINYLIEPHINQVFIAILSTPSWDASSASVEVVSSWQSESDVDLVGVSLSPEQFPAWEQLSSDSVLTINDIYDPQYGLDPLEQTSIESLDTRSLVVIPLRVSSRSIGAIWLGSREVYHYTDQNLRIFQAFAEQTSLSLEASRLLEQTERRARQLETSATISQSIGQILDLDVLLPQVVDLIRDQFSYDHVQVFLMDEDGEYAVLRASTGEAGVQLLGINHRLKKGSDSVIGRVTSQGKPALALDTADANVVHQPNPYLPLTRSEMALPLMIKGEIVGALDVQSNQPNAFIEDDIQVLTTLAAQISVAIDNARLYVDSLRRANEMSFLFDVTSSAAAAEKLDEALQAVTQRVSETLQPLAMVIYLPVLYEDYEQNQIMAMRAAAMAGIDQPISEISEVRVGDAENLVGLVAGTLQSTIISDISRDVRYLPVAPSAKSAVVVPINSGTELIGVIAVEDERMNAYDHDSLTLLLTLSGSLAATIQNRNLVETLQATNEQLREVDRLKSQFLASMSHELRTPLNSIIGFSRVMLKGIDGDLTEMQEQDLTTIYNSGNHLLNLINDILDQAKIEANELNLKFGFFDVKPMVESVKSIAVGLVKEKNIRLNVDIAPNMPQAYGDEFRSRQILLNLVSNAIKFTPEGNVTIHAYAAEGKHGKPVIRLDVQDTGIGIAEKDMSKLFERFRQVDSSLTRTVGGTGLGLAISKSLAELQGGEITVSSEINAGSTFSVIIPTDTAAEEALNIKREAAEKKSSLPVPKPLTQSSSSSNGDTGIMKKTDQTDPPVRAGSDTNRPPLMTREVPAILNTRREVMLIEDNKDMVDQYRRALQREGFEVQTADHPAYARAMAGQLRPNVLILDVSFGNGQGWDILKDLKEADETYDIPVVICTLESDSERAYRLGAHAFLQRPILPDVLVETVKEAEKESRRERILIIDDQPDTIRLLKQLLGEHGNYRVFSAANGKDGIALVARRHPDLVILDLRMPEMDGFTVLQELRANPETANIPVLVVTGDADLNADEQELLRNIRVVPKTDISQEEFEQFLEDVKQHLTNRNNR